MALIDIELGEGMDGVETARRILLARPVPVLFLTGHADGPTIERASTVPHYGYVEKNTSNLVILQAIEMAFRLFYSHRQTRREKENLRATLDSVSDAILVTDRNGRIVSCNAGVHTHFGYEIEALLGKECVTISPPDHRPAHWHAFEHALEHGSHTIEGICVRRDGTRVPVESTFRVRADVDGRPMGCVEVIRDLTPRREYETRLERQRAEMRRLARHLQRAREDQTAYIAREVHDELGQSLSSMEMHVTILEETLAARNVEEAGQTVVELRNILGRTVDKSRQLVDELRPAALDQVGLVESIRQLVQGYTVQSRPTVSFQSEVGEPTIGREEALAFYRIAQEALTNAVRHADAQTIRVSVALDRQDLVLRVADDGLGFDPEAPLESHGILGMRERALSCGCPLLIESGPGTGTIVEVRMGLSSHGEGEG